MFNVIINSLDVVLQINVKCDYNNIETIAHVLNIKNERLVLTALF